MNRCFMLLALVALLALAGTADANRVPSRKADGQRDPGVRPDVTVPYLTTGTSTLGVWQRVSPTIYANPTVSDTKNAGVLPVYNLPTYNAKQALSGSNVGAEPRKPNQLRPNK